MKNWITHSIIPVLVKGRITYVGPIRLDGTTCVYKEEWYTHYEESPVMGSFVRRQAMRYLDNSKLLLAVREELA